MVLSFIIQTLLPGSCHVLFSRVYGENSLKNAAETSEDDAWKNQENRKLPNKNTDLRLERKDRLRDIAERVQSEYEFKAALSGRSYDGDLQRLNDEGKLPDVEMGYFRVEEILGDEGQTTGTGLDNAVVLWMGAMNHGFVLVCDRHENRVLAETVLKLLIRFLQDHCRIFSLETDLPLRGDRVAAVVDQFLPAGRLLFINHRVVRQFEKELDVKMKAVPS